MDIRKMLEGHLAKPPKRWIKSSEVKKMLNISNGTLLSLRKTGQLPFKRVGGLMFYDAGEISHAECGSLFGDEAVIHILKNCVQCGSGVYKFIYGANSTQRTVLRSATDLMLDAMREYDEAERDSSNELADKEAP